MSDKPWIPHKPEDRLSIITFRFLTHALVPPFYVTALADDDEGQRTPQQRMRGKERGQMPGQLDFDVVQGQLSDGGMAPLARKLELKRGDNKLSIHQKTTVSMLRACNAEPVVCWSLKEVHNKLWNEGFNFTANVSTLLQKYEADLEALDRTAALTLQGVIVKKPSRLRKPQPRNVMGMRAYRKANKEEKL